MGQKVHPKIFRIKNIYSWDSKWFARKDYQKFLEEDVKIRTFLMKELRNSAIDRVDIERTQNNLTIIIHTGKPGVIIGRGGQGAEELKAKLVAKFLKKQMQNKDRKMSVNLNIQEVQKPVLSAKIVAESVAMDLEKRMPFRKVMKQTLDKIEKGGALGAKILISGRLNGAEIARREKLSWGKIPLQNLRADIDYARATAFTASYGTIGVKVWIYKGEVFKK
jgi:small subunit ribosomal protein S3